MRQLYRNKEKVGSFTPMMMRAFLRKEEFPIDDYTNPLAVIHTTLKRLHAQNELQSWERHGKTWYRVNPDHVFIDDAYISF